jgi:hypothetical protein
MNASLLMLLRELGTVQHLFLFPQIDRPSSS